MHDGEIITEDAAGGFGRNILAEREEEKSGLREGRESAVSYKSREKGVSCTRSRGVELKWGRIQEKRWTIPILLIPEQDETLD